MKPDNTPAVCRNEEVVDIPDAIMFIMKITMCISMNSYGHNTDPEFMPSLL